jgi:hypothetical protein
MSRSFKDEILLETIHEVMTITGIPDDEILKWSVKDLHQEIKKAHTTPGPYWRIFLRTLKSNIQKRWKEKYKEAGVAVAEIFVLDWPEALETPTSSAASVELDDVADQIRVVSQ